MPIRSLFQQDWAEHAPGGAWNLALPGPSLEHTWAQLNTAYPTIAVSHAIRAPIPCPFWCSWEAPNDTAHGDAWLNRAEEFPAPDTVITAGRHAKTWHGWMSKRHHGDPMIVAQSKLDPLPEPWRDARLDQGPAWVFAIRAMILRGGARLIYVYGLDLKGSGYSFDAPDRKNRTPEEWTGRWVGERNLLERMKALLEALDVVLVRVLPEEGDG